MFQDFEMWYLTKKKTEIGFSTEVTFTLTSAIVDAYKLIKIYSKFTALFNLLFWPYHSFPGETKNWY